MKELIIQFYEKYADYAYRVALVRTNNRADAEDLSQEVVLRIIKNHAILKELIEKDESQAKGYLAKAVVNMTIERYKKSSSRLKRENKFATERMIAIEETDSQDVFDENKHAILKEIKDLPEKYQTILMLKFYEGHSNAELSNMLNVKEVSVRSLISRAIQKLKQRLVVAGVILTTVNITKSLEATELVSAPAEFKAKVIQNIHLNYGAAAKSSWSIFSFKSFAVFGTLGLLAVYFYNETHKDLQTEFMTSNVSKPNIEPKVTITPKLFSLDIDGKRATSENELKDMIESNGLQLLGKDLTISFKNKGIATKVVTNFKDNSAGISSGEDTNNQVKLPYKLKVDTPLEIYLEAFNFTNAQNSKAGTNVQLYFTDINIKRTSTNRKYYVKYTVINNIMYFESSVFEGLLGFHIREQSFDTNICVNLTNISLQKIRLKELNSDEVMKFREKNSELVQKVESTPIYKD